MYTVHLVLHCVLVSPMAIMARGIAYVPYVRASSVWYVQVVLLRTDLLPPTTVPTSYAGARVYLLGPGGPYQEDQEDLLGPGGPPAGTHRLSA